MADRRQQLPIRVRLPEAEPAPPMTLASYGDEARRLAQEGVRRTMNSAAGVASTLVPGAAALVPIAKVASSQRGRVAVRNAIQELTGTKPEPVPVVQNRGVGPIEPITAALQQGRAAPVQPTTMDRVNGAVEAILSRPFTIRQAQAAVGMAPAAAKPPTAKDNMLTTAGGIADTLYKADLAKAAKLSDQNAKDEANIKATDRYLSVVAALTGADLTKLQFAENLEE
jgi:hypothetical protein